MVCDRTADYDTPLAHDTCCSDISSWLENSKILGIGVDELVNQGFLKHLLPGPLYWVDTAGLVRSRPVLGGSQDDY